MKQGQVLLLALLMLFLTGCTTTPPKDQGNLCSIYREYPDWYEDSLQMQSEYGTPLHVAMAIMKQESSYVADALPPRDYLLWVIPWGRVSSAYGYAQAQDPVWGEYKDNTGNGGSRDSFDDAIMFIGWYTTGTQRQLGISKWDTYNQYLAYHEGRGGFSRNTYRSKPWLMQVAQKVQKQSEIYNAQLKVCRQELEDERSGWF
ncbi:MULTISPECIES: hypothetical protein [Pseudomonas]|uniref:transglycosylase SLT domain-containing protein n=1 Tax=Pseudomonas TaxID=286 RepID=UPI001C449463|nr:MULTISPECIES: hypothetical protein [unclassified Pseudomonas]MBV7492086.1 hypothetical protein [Pseudomonas sp. PDM30]